MYRLEVKRRLCVPRINYKEERKELIRQMQFAVVMKAASGPVNQDYAEFVSTLPPQYRPKGNEELKKLHGQMQVAALLKGALNPASEDYTNIVSTLPVPVFRPGVNDNLTKLHHHLKKATLLKAAWQLVDKSLPKPDSVPKSALPDQGNENHGTLKRKVVEEDVAESHKRRRVVKDTD